MNGVVYIAFGGNKKADHIREAIHSVNSLKKIHPEISTTIFTDNESVGLVSGKFNHVEVVDINGERMKQELLWNSPYDNTLYLDSDTCVVGDIDSLFELMGRFDIAACFDHGRKVEEWAKVYPAYGRITSSFSEFAGGVILFRKCSLVEGFFNTWKRNYRDWKKLSGRINDQPSFRVSLWECRDLSIYTLPPEYNLRTQEKRDKFKGVPKILHWHDMYNLTLRRTPQAF